MDKNVDMETILMSVLLKQLRANPDVGDFDDEEVVARYKELKAKHEEDAAKGKPGWMLTPDKVLRDELIRKAHAGKLIHEHDAMSNDLAYVTASGQVILQKSDGVEHLYSVSPAPTNQFIDALVTLVDSLVKSEGGTLPVAVTREVCENFIHAYFQGVLIIISKGGKRIRFSDEGPGYYRSTDFQASGYTTATQEMKPYITHLGEGFPCIKAALAEAPQHFTLLYGNNLGPGFNVWLVEADESEVDENDVKKGDEWRW